MISQSYEISSHHYEIKLTNMRYHKTEISHRSEIKLVIMTLKVRIETLVIILKQKS